MLKYFWLINIFFVVAGCSFFGKERIKPSSLLPFEQMVFVEKVWTFENKTRLDARDISLVTVPTVLGENVIIPARNGVVTILKLATGQIEERIELGVRSLSQIGVEVDEGSYNFAFVSADGKLMFFNSKNKVLWSTQLNGIVRMAPKIGELGVIVRQEDNKVLAYDKVGGKLLWSISKRTIPLILHAQSDMGFVGDESTGLTTIKKNLAVNLAGGELILLNSKTGSVIWQKRLAFPKGQNEVERIVDLLGVPFLDNQEICTSVYQTKLVCVSKGTGDVEWENSEKILSPGFFKFPLAATVGLKDEVKLFNREENVEVWRNEELRYRDLSKPIIWDGSVWVTDSFGILHGLSILDGNTISRYDLKRKSDIVSFIVTGSGLLITDVDGHTILIKKRE
ncbi:PQQ-binding-like beta-propeller repeat protein [Betaproteobacteria bacterium]|nr:PQQ-binding-like beta-propeller repeat protein [Betaproteobacteria bacterium]